MDVKAFPALIVGVVVALVLAGAVLPVFAETTSAEDTFKNEGYYRMSEITEDTNVTVGWDHTKPNSIFVNEVEYSINVEVNRLVTIVGTDTMIVRFVASTNNQNTRVQAYSSAGFIQATVTNNTDMEITITNTSISATVGDTTKTMTITSGYYIDPSGAWTMKKADDSAYIHKSDSVMIFSGVTNIGTDVGLYGTGTIDDGMDINYVPTSSATPTVTFGDVTFNYSAVSSYIDLVSLNDCTFDITIAGTPDTTGTATYSYFIVPYEVTAEKAVHPDGPLSVMLNVLPLLAIAGLVTGAVVWFINRKG